MAETTILDALEAYLNGAAALTRDPQVAVANRYPLWIEPNEGTPAPGEGATTIEKDPNLVIGAFQSPGLGAPRYEDFIRSDGVILMIRARKAFIAHEFEFKLRDALHDKRKWQMGPLVIIESLLFRPMQRLSSDPKVVNFTTEYLFERYSP